MHRLNIVKGLFNVQAKRHCVQVRALSELRALLGAQVGLDLGAPAARAAFEHVSMVQQPIEERRDGRGVPKQFSPIVNRSIRGQERGCALVAPHDELQEIFGGRVLQFAHAKVVDDQERDRGQLGEVVLASR